MRSVLLILCLLALCVMTAGLVREYIYISKSLPWSHAQSYCRKYYVDLATITTEEENQRNSFFSEYHWIGLRATLPGSGSWCWSDGELPYYFNWGSEQPNNLHEKKNCVAIESSEWINTNCSILYPFICYRRLILVQERKTWNEALQYCRTYFTDLYSPISNTQLNLVDQQAMETQSVSVWTGLRFLDGKWFWLNWWPVENQLSLHSCPAQQYRCGARSTETYVWENRNCNEKLSFLCY